MGGSSRQSSSSGSVNRPRNTGPLAPLEVAGGQRREARIGQDTAEEASLHADIFAPCADVTISPAIGGGPFDCPSDVIAPQMFGGAIIDDHTPSMMRSGADPTIFLAQLNPERIHSSRRPGLYGRN